MGKLSTKKAKQEPIYIFKQETSDNISNTTSLPDKYLINNSLITNSENDNLLNILKEKMLSCERFFFSVAFINFSGIQLLLDTFNDLEAKGIKGKIITTTYMNFTEPKALKHIKNFKNIDLKIFIATHEKGFHTKAYIFENKEDYNIIIGSSNITQKALKVNVEWNVKVISKKDNDFVKNVIFEYENLWGENTIVDDDFINKYEEYLNEIKKYDKERPLFLNEFELIRPNFMQEKAILGIAKLRKLGKKKAMVIAATGTGKTYMSAFDVLELKPKKMLFLAHREELLINAEKTFVKIYKNRKIRTGFLTGKKKDIKADYLFSTMQSMNNNYESFKKDDFNYIVIDECHHAASAIYENLVSYFEPEFLLGMTATPERTDSKNIFDIFDNNVALEIRLKEALKENLLVPFHYFGITDIEDIDIANINIDDIKEIAIRLSINKRVEYIIEKMDFYGFDGPKRKALGFCASIEHAKYMRDEFNIRNIPSLCITGEENPTERIAAIKKLEDENDKLEVIFTVDVFNEGIDIPSLNLVLMLRPTNSPIIFIQQLGRGLRKNIGKEFLTVLDFIGNHSKAFLIAIALNGSRYYDKDSLKVAVKNNFSEIGGCTNIHMERISQQRIIDQLNYENFNTMKYLKEEYAEFKNICKGRIPKSLIDYIIYEGAPDPIKFIDIKKSYLKFLSKAEKEDFKGLTNRISFMNILEELSSKLPIKRIYEFVILKYLLSNASITIEIAKVEILKHIENVAERDIEHSFQYLNQQYYDPSQKERKIKFVELNENILTKLPILEEILLNADMRFWIVDIINYGILRYEKEFGSTYYGTPFLKKYEQYRMTDVALLSNYTKLFSSYRGSGLITNGDDYFIFVNLHKGEKTPENINYKDKLKTQELFQWQSPNATRQDSDRGRNIIFNTERNIKLHLFIRKHEEVDGAAQQFLYLGECNSIKDSAIGERPITIQMKLEHPIPLTLYKDLTEIVN